MRVAATLALLAPLAAADLVAALPSPVISLADTACIVMGRGVEGRRSPLDSVTFAVQGSPVKICYGRPAARGRTMIGSERVPYGRLWRTGANEPSMIHTTVPLTIAGIEVAAGSYSLYTVPGEKEWQVIVNRSISQWGHERYYAGEVAAQEIARAPVKREQAGTYIEVFTIRAEATPEGNATLLLEWEDMRVRVPVKKLQ